MTTVRGIGEDLARAIVAEREANGSYRSLADLLRRTGLPRPVAEHLIAVGALSELGLSRRELLWQLGLLLPGHGSWAVGRGASRLAARRGRQVALALPTEQDMVRLKDMDDWERMVTDYGLLGLSPSYHPLGLLRAHLPGDVLTADQLRAARDGACVCTAGLVVCRQRPGTAKGFVFLLLEDETGLTNVVVRPDLYEAERSVIRGEPYLRVEGTLQLRSGTLNLLATRVAPLARVPGPLPEEAPSPAPAPPLSLSPAPPSPPSPAPALRLAKPASHDFH